MPLIRVSKGSVWHLPK